MDFRWKRWSPAKALTYRFRRGRWIARSAIRFTTGAGGGVKLFPTSHFGVRLDSRLYATFVDADLRFLACTPGTCISSVNVDVVWQAEFSAGLIVRLR